MKQHVRMTLLLPATFDCKASQQVLWLALLPIRTSGVSISPAVAAANVWSFWVNWGVCSASSSDRVAKSRDISSRNRTRNGFNPGRSYGAPKTKLFFSQLLRCTLRNARNIRSSVHWAAAGRNASAQLAGNPPETAQAAAVFSDSFWIWILWFPAGGDTYGVHWRVVNRLVDELLEVLLSIACLSYDTPRIGLRGQRLQAIRRRDA